jgi:voltage-gated potassium channel Kch
LDQAVIAGFGLAGRAVADLLDEVGVPYTVIEKNPATVRTQNGLGRRFIAGDTSQEATLAESGVATASLLALTIPDVKAVLAATAAARKLSSAVYIIARTTYSSEGLQAMRLGANEVIKAEQAVALQFYERVLQLTGLPMTPAPGKTGMV